MYKFSFKKTFKCETYYPKILRYLIWSKKDYKMKLYGNGLSKLIPIVVLNNSIRHVLDREIVVLLFKVSKYTDCFTTRCR